MTDIKLADISEYQDDFNADAYLRAGHRAIIVRTHTGYRPDRKMPGRRDYVRGKPFVAVGWYIYLVRDRDPAQQAREFIATIGQLRANEFPILDLEEGSGSQVARAEAFFAVVDPWARFPTSLYTGSSMLRDQLGGAARWGKRPLWIAAYPSTYTPNPRYEPAGADWWQYSDRERFPGLTPGDGSIFHGTTREFLAVARAGSGPPAPPPRIQLAPVTMPDGRQELFALLGSGEVLHCWQNHEFGWERWRSLGTPGR